MNEINWHLQFVVLQLFLISDSQYNSLCTHSFEKKKEVGTD